MQQYQLLHMLPYKLEKFFLQNLWMWYDFIFGSFQDFRLLFLKKVFYLKKSINLNIFNSAVQSVYNQIDIIVKHIWRNRFQYRLNDFLPFLISNYAIIDTSY